MTETYAAPATRRQLLGAAGGIALALAATPHRTLAQEPANYSNHPLAGMWLAMANPALPENSPFPAPSWFSADGNVVLAFPPSDIGPNGAVLQSSPVGVWEPYDDRTGHFTVVQTLSTPDGTLIGSVTINGYPSVDADNMTFTDRNDLTHVTIRDASGAVLQEVPPDPNGRKVTAIRMKVDAPGFPETIPAATPAS